MSMIVQKLFTTFHTAAVLLLNVLFFPPRAFAARSSDDSVIYNPLKAKSFQELAADIINVLVQIGIPIAVFFIIYAGFLYVTARGSEEKVKKAHQTLLWAIVGTAVLLGASVIARAIQGTIDQIKAGP